MATAQGGIFLGFLYRNKKVQFLLRQHGDLLFFGLSHAANEKNSAVWTEFARVTLATIVASVCGTALQSGDKKYHVRSAQPLSVSKLQSCSEIKKYLTSALLAFCNLAFSWLAWYLDMTMCLFSSIRSIRCGRTIMVRLLLPTW